MRSFREKEPITLPEGPSGERWELLHRVVASQMFEKSNRLRELLLFVGERALLYPDAPIPEQEIGVQLFGRPPGYETSQDTLVRVQASQLRKRLQEYFNGEGRDEPIIIELPRGCYVPVFRTRAAAQTEVAVAAPSVARRSWLPWAATAALVLVCGALLIQNAGLREIARPGLPSSPEVDRFWRQVLGNSQANYLVLSDVNLVVFQDAIRRHLSLEEYQNRAFGAAAAAHIEDPARRLLILNVYARPYISLADADLARRMTLVCAANQLSLNVLIARQIRASQIAVDNTILLGSRRANPWVNLFEDRLNFRTGFEESPRAAYFTNHSPRPGEKREYRGVFGQLSFCRVALLPNSRGIGNVLLISGTEITSTDAGGEFVTNDKWIGELRAALKLSASEPLPYFEALLRGAVVGSAVPYFDLIAVRRY